MVIVAICLLFLGGAAMMVATLILSFDDFDDDYDDYDDSCW